MTEVETIMRVPSHLDAKGGLAGRYAQAFFNFAEEQSSLEASVKDAARLATALRQNPQLKRFMSDKRIALSESVRAVEGIVDFFNTGDAMRRFMGVVAQNRRLAHLEDILKTIAVLYRERQGVVVAEVSSACALTDAQRNVLRAHLAQQGYQRLEVFETVDPALIGGLTVRIGDKLIDSSISGRLTRLQFAMKGAA